MAERNRTNPLIRAALLLIVGVSAGGFAQSPGGSVRIQLTDLYAKPLTGASVTLRNRTTGALSQTIAAKGGVYRCAGLEPGEYTLDASSPSQGSASLHGIEVTAGQEAHVLAAIELAPAPRLTSDARRPETEPREPGYTLLPPPEKVEGERLAPRITRAEGDQPPPASRPAPELALLPRIPEAAVASLAGRNPAQAFLPALAPALAHEGANAPAIAMPPAQAMLRALPQVPKPAIEIAESVPDGASPPATLPAAELQALPLAGRDWQSLAPEARTDGGDTESEDAAPSRDFSAVTVDGANTAVAFGVARGSRSRGQSARLLGPGTSEATIRTLEMASGASAFSTGRSESGGMNVASERGGNALHGHELLFDRQNMLGARNPFAQWVQQTAPATATTVPVFTPTPYSPGDRERTWGLTVGGPIFRRKAFWFASLENIERNDPAISTVKHPDHFFAQPANDQMQVLSARLGLSSSNPVVAGLGAYSSVLQSLGGLLGPAPRTSRRWTGFGRVDWAAGERNRFALETSGALSDAPGGGLGQASETYGTHSFGSRKVDDQWLLARWETILAPNLLAVTQVSLGRHFVAMTPEKPSPFEQSLNIGDWGRLPQIVVDSRYGFTIGNPSRFGSGAYPDEHLYEVQQQLDWRRGGFLVRSGFDFRHNNDATGLLRNQTGTYHYSSLENFASDELAFAAFGLNGQLDPLNQHNCDQTGKAWRDSAGTLHGLGYLPCYAWYSQTMGPSNWWLGASDWASHLTAQWQPRKTLVASLAMRWQLQQAPPAMTLLHNSDLPLTTQMPRLGSEWGPRVSIAWGARESRLPVLRLGYGMYFGRTANATLENALTQTGSLKGDLNFFMRPTDNLNTGGAPPFPYVLAGEPATVVKPGAVEFAPAFHNGEVHQAAASVEETLPGHVHVDASAMASLGRRLPVTEDANLDPAMNPQTITYAVVDGNASGPIKTSQITVPFFASWPSAQSSTGFAGRLNPNYQQVTEIFSRANSTYEAAILRVTRTGRDGLTLHLRYTFAHAADWNPHESATVSGPSVLDPGNWNAEYGTSNLDVRHAASVAIIWEPRWRLHGETGRILNGPLLNGWMVSGIGSFRSGLPYSMRTAGSLAKEFTTTGTAIVALAPGMTGYGGDNRVYGTVRNAYRYPATWKADMRLAKHFNLGAMRQLELLAESFNLFNHQNVTELETVGYSIEPGNGNGSLPTLNYLTGLKTGQTEFGRPLNINATDFYRPRQIQFGLRVRF